MAKTSAESKKDNRTVIDQYGHSYLLTGRLGEGGQGIVCTTNYPNVLIKIVRASTLEKQQTWVNKIKALMRQPEQASKQIVENHPAKVLATTYYAPRAGVGGEGRGQY